MKEYLIETKSIDYMNPHIQEKVQELKDLSCDDADYIKRAYIFVRDEIPHSWDIQTNIVSRTALFAALLRANGIPSGISYQLLTIAEDDSLGHIVHALNTVYIEDSNKWIRLDARGNVGNGGDEFSLEKDCLAFSPRSEFGEIDYKDNNPDLDERLVNKLEETENLMEMNIDFEF